MKVWLPTGVERPLLRQVDLQPVYNQSGEQPVHVQLFTEGEVRWYGSGTADVVVSILPIRVRIPWRVVSGRIRWGVADHMRREMAMALRKLTTPAAGVAASGPGASDVASWPVLWEYLTATAYPDGTARETASLIIVADAGGWRGCLSDKDNQRTMWKTSNTLEGLLLLLEEGAASDDPGAWRAAGGGFKNRRKRS